MDYFSASSLRSSSKTHQQGSRQGVGKPGHMKFTVDPHKKRKSSFSQGKSHFTPKKKTPHKNSSFGRVNPILFKWFYRVSWVAWLFLFVRLFVMDQGVIDYYQMDRLILKKKQEVIETHRENESLHSEIQRIKVDSKYQKKLARDHLNVIADDEYLVLFSREANQRSR